MAIWDRLTRTQPRKEVELTPRQIEEAKELEEVRRKSYHQEAIKQVKMQGSKQAQERYNPKVTVKQSNGFIGMIRGSPAQQKIAQNFLHPNKSQPKKATVRYVKKGKHYVKRYIRTPSLGTPKTNSFDMNSFLRS